MKLLLKALLFIAVLFCAARCPAQIWAHLGEKPDRRDYLGSGCLMDPGFSPDYCGRMQRMYDSALAQWNKSHEEITQVKYDTVPVLLLVTDTAKITSSTTIYWGGKINDYLDHNPHTWTQRGYEVRKIDPHGYRESIPDDHPYTLEIKPTRWVERNTHFTYLDADKHPLTLFVWESKTITK